MKILKSISSFFSNKVETAIEKATKPEDMYRDAARQLIGEIDRLKHTRVSSVREIVNIDKLVEKHSALHKSKEDEIVLLQRSGADVSKNHIILALQHRNIVTGLGQKKTGLSEMNNQIDASVVELSTKLDDIKMNLDIIALNEETAKLGLTIPEDVIAAVGHVNVNVDTLITKVDVLMGGSQSMASVTSGDIASYMEELKNRA